MLFFVIYNSKLNIFEFWTVGRTRHQKSLTNYKRQIN